MTAVETTVLAPAFPALPEQVPPARFAVRSHWRIPVRIALWTGLAVAFVTVCAVDGLPTDRVVLLCSVLRPGGNDVASPPHVPASRRG